ncbi:MAG: anti-sigma factor family protein [bacterium]
MKKKCITEEQCIDYLEKRLSDEERSQIEKHIAGCDRCLDELVIAGKMLRDDTLSDTQQTELEPAPEYVTKRAIERVKALKDDSPLHKASPSRGSRLSGWISKCADKFSELLPSGVPELATVRGTETVITEDHKCIKKSFDTLEAKIEFEKKGEDRTLIRIMIPDKDRAAQPIRVTLVENEREVSSYLIDEAAALFEDIPNGHYTLIFIREGNTIGEYPFEIKGLKGQ